MITDKGTGLERVQREAFLVLFNNLNIEIGIMESAWSTLDEELATVTGNEYLPITLETIENINFYLGHRPSLIEAPITRYPNISVMAYQASPSAPDNIDQVSVYANRLFVEIMVKSTDYAQEDGQFEAEREVNSRIQRTTDAVNNVLTANRTLNGTVAEISRTPSVVISDVFIRKTNTSYGNEWLWQGSRLEYEVNKVARLDESSTGIFREGLAIDQIP